MSKRLPSLPAAALALIGMGTIVGAVPAAASDSIYSLSIADALASDEAKEKLDPSVHFYFGDTAHPAVQQSFGDYVSNRKTNSFLKGDQGVCTHVFLSTLIEFQKRAQSMGANAVINIHSYYKKVETSDNAQIPCHVGGLMAGIAIKGEVVKLRQP